MSIVLREIIKIVPLGKKQTMDATDKTATRTVTDEKKFEIRSTQIETTSNDQNPGKQILKNHI